MTKELTKKETKKSVMDGIRFGLEELALKFEKNIKTITQVFKKIF